MNVNVMVHAIGACVVGTLAGTAAAQVQPPQELGPTARAGQRSAHRIVVQVAPGVRIQHRQVESFVSEGLSGEDLARASASLGDAGVAGVYPVFESFAHPALAHEIGLDRYYLIETVGVGNALAGDLRELPGVFNSVEMDPIGGEFLQFPDKADGGAGLGMASNVDDPGTDDFPNDPLFGQQWALHNTGQTIDGQAGTPGADIDAVGAWSLLGQPNGSPIIVAVLDTGASPHHPDLQGHYVQGYNTLGDPDNTDDGTSSHGTHVSGIIAAARDNNLGVSGMCARVRIMPIRVFNEIGLGFETQFVQGLTWAVDHGADVASMSLGYPTATSLMYDTCHYAYVSGVVMVASTGNTPGQPVLYPAKYSATIGVGATDNRDVLWANSTTGSEVSVVAPGVDVLSTWDTPTEPDTYKLQTGTSQAAPYVSAVAAMILFANRDLSVDDVGWVLTTTAEDLGAPGWDSSYGYGRINASLAVAAAKSLGASGNCRVDLDGDGRFTLSDVNLFVLYFYANDPRADLAPAFGVLNSADIQAFVDEVSGGCGGG